MVAVMVEFVVRAVRPDEWKRVRDFRIEALCDEVAPIAFTATLDDALAHPDELWQRRALAGSEDAGRGARQRSLVALDGDRWCGTLTVLITEPGEGSFIGETPSERTADVVAVYVSPSVRGSGIIEALLEAAADWASSQGILALQLFVHAQNLRAQRAYEKSGFAFTGEALELGENRELKMMRPIEAAAGAGV